MPDHRTDAPDARTVHGTRDLDWIAASGRLAAALGIHPSVLFRALEASHTHVIPD